MGSGLGRSSRWGRFTDYVRTSHENICLIVQVESRTALENIEAIAATEGVDGVLLGPSDLAADLGYPEQRTHPEVVDAIRRSINILRRVGMPVGIMLTDVPAAQKWLKEGVTFAGVGADSSLLIRAADELLGRFRGNEVPVSPAANAY